MQRESFFRYYIFIFNAVIFLACEKLLTEPHPACIAGSKQHIGNPISEANAYIGIYCHWY